MKKSIFSGVGTAMITPQTNEHANRFGTQRIAGNKGIDYKALEELIERQIAAKADALVMCGSTGMPHLLSEFEEDNIVKRARDIIGKRAKLIVGTGSNSTNTTLERSERLAEMAKADGVMLINPSYAIGSLSQEALFNHYNTVMTALRTPAIVYNVPGRMSGANNIEPQTAARLSKNPYMFGFKEANPAQMKETLAAIDGRAAVYSGDDAANFGTYLDGSDGCISVRSNVSPEHEVALWNLVRTGKRRETEALNALLEPVANALFPKGEPNPVAVQWDAYDQGLTQNPNCRLPLPCFSEPNQIKLRAARQELLADTK